MSSPRSGYKLIEALDGAEGVSKAVSDHRMLEGYGEEHLRERYVIEWDAQRPMPSYCPEFCMALAANTRFCPLRVLRRASGPAISVLLVLIVRRTGSLGQEAGVTWPGLRPVR
jgi:hypothetical protein